MSAGMRRSLLTRGGPPFTSVGSSTGVVSSGLSRFISISGAYPADGTGFINTVSIRSANTETSPFSIFTCSPTFVCTDIVDETDTVSSSTTVNRIFTMDRPLAVNKGDYIGVYSSDGFNVWRSLDGASGINTWLATAGTRPSPGGTITGLTNYFDELLLISGTP
jgi:hypothetical protein